MRSSLPPHPWFDARTLPQLQAELAVWEGDRDRNPYREDPVWARAVEDRIVEIEDRIAARLEALDTIAAPEPAGSLSW